MKYSRVTIRYAKALLQLSVEEKSLDSSYRDMVLLDSICSESKELSLLLKSPIVKTDRKLKIFNLMKNWYAEPVPNRWPYIFFELG